MNKFVKIFFLNAIIVITAIGFQSLEAQHGTEPVGLYLTWQHDPTTTMTIDWHTLPTDEAKKALVYKEVGTNNWRQVLSSQHAFPYSDRTIHRVELTGLNPGTKYRFKVGEFEREYKFRTMPVKLDKPLRFGAGGDTRHTYEWMLKTNRVAMEHDLDFVIWGGDLAYADGDPALIYRWYDWFKANMKGLISENGRVVPIIVALGNHEQFYESRLRNGTYPHGESMPEEEIAAYMEEFELYDRKVTFFYDLFAFPGKPAYNILDFGNYMSLIVLDTNHDVPVPGEQTDWLEEVLEERNDRPHLFPVYHVPAFPSHRPYDNRVAVLIREHWVPLFENNGVRVAFENHDHRYKRTPPIKNEKIDDTGIVYLGDGAWGVDVHSVGDNSNEWFIEKFSRERHAIIVTLQGSHQHYLVVNEDGIVIDEYPRTTVNRNDINKLTQQELDDGWKLLFDGKSLEGWKAAEDPSSFWVEDGRIVVDGPRGHLFYEGPIANGGDFLNFEFKADVYTYPQANSGIFFHTNYQNEGWPQDGYEAQINATHRDPRKTGSLYAVQDVMDEAPHEDHEWFEYHIIVDNKDITFKINNETVNEFSEPEDREGTIRLSRGTIALQAHDPDSRIYFRNLKIRLLPG